MFYSCNDGDVITVALEFDQILVLCNEESIQEFEDLENLNSYVIYDTKADPNESLILLFPTSTDNNLIFNPPYNTF